MLNRNWRIEQLIQAKKELDRQLSMGVDGLEHHGQLLDYEAKLLDVETALTK